MPQASTLNIALGLAALAKARRRTNSRKIMTLDELAEFCGCHREAIRKIELSALEKIRIRLAGVVTVEDVRHAFNVRDNAHMCLENGHGTRRDGSTFAQ